MSDSMRELVHGVGRIRVVDVAGAVQEAEEGAEGEAEVKGAIRHVKKGKRGLKVKWRYRESKSQEV